MSVHPAVVAALQAYKQGHVAQAEAALRQFLNRHPTDAVAGVALAQLCVDSGRGAQGEFWRSVCSMLSRTMPER